MISNILEGGAGMGTVPTIGQVSTKLPGPYAANSWPIAGMVLARLTASVPLVSYIPLPQGAIILDAFLDPIAASASSFTMSLGNETGGDADFGTIAVTAAATVRVNAAAGVVGANYSGLRGNSVKLTLSALPTGFSADAQKSDEPKNEHRKENDHKDEHRKEAKKEELFRKADEHPSRKTKDEAEEKKLQAVGPPYGTYAPGDIEPLEKANGKTVSSGAFLVAQPLADPTLTLLAQPLNNTTDSVVAIQNGHPEVALGWILQCGSEQMLVTSVINANNFNVQRAVYATVKAAHAVNAPVLLGAAPATGPFYAVLAIRFVMQ